MLKSPRRNIVLFSLDIYQKVINPIQDGGRGAKKRSKMTKSSVRRASCLRNDTSYDCRLWYTCVK